MELFVVLLTLDEETGPRVASNVNNSNSNNGILTATAAPWLESRDQRNLMVKHC